MNARKIPEMNTQGKRKRKGTGCLIVLLSVVVLLMIGGGIGWAYVSREHREILSLPLNAVNFARLKDGTYRGVYEGGMYKWRANECEVQVTGGKVTDINLVRSTDLAKETPGAEMLYERVIAKQSLQVDTISSSTVTSKGYLQAVENALIPAQY